MTCAQPRDIPFGTLGNRVLHVLLPASHPQCSLNPRGDDWGIGEPVCERRPTLLADAPTLLPSGTEGGKGTEAATLASRRASRARPSSNRACSNLVAPEMRLIHISMPLNHPVLSRIALLPPLCPLCGLIRSSWTDASTRTCVYPQTCFAHRNSATRIRPQRSLDLDTTPMLIFL